MGVIKLDCPKCGKHYSAPAAKVGTTGKCGACGARFSVESTGAVLIPAPAVPPASPPLRSRTPTPVYSADGPGGPLKGAGPVIPPASTAVTDASSAVTNPLPGSAGLGASGKPARRSQIIGGIQRLWGRRGWRRGAYLAAAGICASLAAAWLLGAFRGSSAVHGGPYKICSVKRTGTTNSLPVNSGSRRGSMSPSEPDSIFVTFEVEVEDAIGKSLNEGNKGGPIILAEGLTSEMIDVQDEQGAHYAVAYGSDDAWDEPGGVTTFLFDHQGGRRKLGMAIAIPQTKVRERLILRIGEKESFPFD